MIKIAQFQHIREVKPNAKHRQNPYEKAITNGAKTT
jgi:hypothetical protein